jgi:uncharacterized lipoprotein YmbA
MAFRARSARAAALVAAALAIGCGTASPHFYTLSSASGPASGPPLASRPELSLAVGPLEFPRYLDRPELVTRDGSHRLIVADAHRWGGSMRSDILRVVADDLGRLLGTARVAVYPADPSVAADYRVLLEVREFEGVPGEKVRLRALWTIAPTAARGTPTIQESIVEQPIASKSYEDLVSAESVALGTVTRTIAEALVGLPGR